MIENKEDIDKELVLEEFFEKYGFPENYDNWSVLWQSCYRNGLYIGIVTERKEHK